MGVARTSTPGAASSRTRAGEEGFSLLEVLTALSLLAVGLLSLAGVFTMSLAVMTGASWDMIAKEKAAQTIENILAARDAGRLPFTSINNVGTGTGIFVTGAQPLIDAGDDRLIGTADDNAGERDTVVRPGPNGLLGDEDDEVVPLSHFTRQIVVTQVEPYTTLRQVRVIIRYRIGGISRQLELSSYVSSFTG
jgi:prepilin-type N-terminal cleavage/methylation domain-containing protein